MLPGISALQSRFGNAYYHLHLPCMGLCGHSLIHKGTWSSPMSSLLPFFQYINRHLLPHSGYSLTNERTKELCVAGMTILGCCIMFEFSLAVVLRFSFFFLL